MLPLIAAKLANPFIKYGLMGATVIALWIHGYYYGKGVEREYWEQLFAKQTSENIAKQAVEEQAMSSAVTKEDIQAKREVKERIKIVNKEVIRYVDKNPSKPLDSDLIRMYDTLLGVLNSTARDLPTPDADAGTSEVSRGGLASPPAEIIHLDTDEGQIDLTTDELIQAVVDMSEKYALMKQSYKGATDWNEGREKIELERLGHE